VYIFSKFKLFLEITGQQLNETLQLIAASHMANHTIANPPLNFSVLWGAPSSQNPHQ